jgi:hypothetical protein
VRRRGWLWVGAAATVLAGMVALSVRSAGSGRLAAVLRRLEAAGEAPTPDEWRRTLPPVDGALQARIRAWAAGGPTDSGWSSEDEDWWFEGRAEPPTRVAEWFRDARPRAEALAALLRQPGACLSSFGWLPPVAALGPQARNPYEFLDLHPVLDAARWYSVASMRESDRADALDALARLSASSRPAAGIMDFARAHMVDAVRDRARLRRAVGAALDRAALDAFCDEEPDAADLLADALRAERVLLWLPPARALAGGASFAAAFPPERPRTLRAWWGGIASSLDGEDDCAGFLERWVAEERWVRAPSGPPRRVAESFAPPTTRPFAAASSSLPSFAHTVSAVRWRHRATRAAAWIAAHVREGAPLPGDRAEAAALLGARASLLDPGVWDPATAYERLGADRFRLRPDTSRPLPEWLDPSELTTPRSPTWIRADTWSVEIRLPR